MQIELSAKESKWLKDNAKTLLDSIPAEGGTWALPDNWVESIRELSRQYVEPVPTIFVAMEKQTVRGVLNLTLDRATL